MQETEDQSKRNTSEYFYVNCNKRERERERERYAGDIVKNSRVWVYVIRKLYQSTTKKCNDAVGLKPAQDPLSNN